MTANIKHASRSHAILSASGAHRWLHCTPSAKLEAEKPDQSSAAAKEGTAAHELAEYKLRQQLGLEVYEDEPPHAPDWYSQEMEQHASAYAAFCTELYQAAKKQYPETICRVEHRLDLSKWVPDGFGTGDFFYANHHELHIIDLKYGRGVTVAAENNPQLMLYALGVWDYVGFLFETIETVTVSIFQPRVNNIVTWSLPLADLLDWAVNTLQPAAIKAWRGEGDFAPGSWCQFCKVQGTCRALAEENLRAAQKEFTNLDELTPQEIAEILGKADQISGWLKSVKEHALAEGLRGTPPPGFKVVAGRSVRKISDPAEFTLRAVKAGYQPSDLAESKLKGITALEKLLGKKQLAQIAGDLLVKPEGAPTLVPESDKRPALHSAQAEFQILD